MSPWVVFVFAGAAVVAAGTLLARAADEIAEATGIGRAWIGSVLLAAATSLPELATDVAAVRLGAVDLALGDLFGSSLSNMLVLGVLGMTAAGRVFQVRHEEYAFTAAIAVALHALAAVHLVRDDPTPVLGVTLETVSIAALYLWGTRAAFRMSARGTVPLSRPPQVRTALRAATARFAGAAAAILVAAPWFARSAHAIAESTGLGGTFVGTTLVGMSTSLPELVASLAAVRLGSHALAVGNLFGSNAVNMALLVVLDAAAPPGGVLAAASPHHEVTALFAILMMCLGLGAFLARLERRFDVSAPGSAAIVLAWVAAILALARVTAAP